MNSPTRLLAPPPLSLLRRHFADVTCQASAVYDLRMPLLQECVLSSRSEWTVDLAPLAIGHRHDLELIGGDGDGVDGDGGELP